MWSLGHSEELVGEAYELRIEDEFLELLAGTKDRAGHGNWGTGVIFQLHKMD